MLPNSGNLRSAPPTRGRHLNKRVALGLVVVLGLGAVWLLLPKGATPPAQRSWQPPSEMTRMVKDSQGLQKMKIKENGVPSSEPTMLPSPAPVDTSEIDRLRKENEQYRALLNKVPPKVETKPAVAPARPPVDATAKQRDDERQKLAQADRKLIVRQASDTKDASSQIMKINYPLTPYTLAPNWKIPCITEGPVSNEVPGSFGLRVRQPVYDSATGRHVVIPQSSGIVAEPRGQAVLQGDGRLGIGLQKLAFPDASWITLAGTSGQDKEGHTGFSDQVDRRFWSLAASIVIYPLIRSGTSVMPQGNYGDPLGTVGRNVAQEASQQSQQVTRQFLRTEPIIFMRPGYECMIYLNEPMSLSRAWSLD